MAPSEMEGRQVYLTLSRVRVNQGLLRNFCDVLLTYRIKNFYQCVKDDELRLEIVSLCLLTYDSLQYRI